MLALKENEGRKRKQNTYISNTIVIIQIFFSFRYWTLIMLLFSFFNFFFKDPIYLLMRETEREAETQAEGEAGSLWEARCGS